MGVFVAFENEVMIPTMVPEGGFYKVSRIKSKTAPQGRVLCSDNCLGGCEHYRNGECARLSELNREYEKIFAINQQEVSANVCQVKGQCI